MKRFLMLMFLALLSLPILAQVVDPPTQSWFAANWQLIIALIVGVYEAVVRLIPSVGNYSIIAKIIQLLQWLSEALDNKKVE